LPSSLGKSDGYLEIIRDYNLRGNVVFPNGSERNYPILPECLPLVGPVSTRTGKFCPLLARWLPPLQGYRLTSHAMAPSLQANCSDVDSQIIVIFLYACIDEKPDVDAQPGIENLTGRPVKDKIGLVNSSTSLG